MRVRKILVKVGWLLSITFAYVICRVCLEILRVRAGVGADTGTPLDLLGLLVCIGVAGLAAGSVVALAFLGRAVLGTVLAMVVLLLTMTIDVLYPPLLYGLVGVYGWGTLSVIAWACITGFFVGFQCANCGKVLNGIWTPLLLVALVLVGLWVAFVPMERYLMLF